MDVTDAIAGSARVELEGAVINDSDDFQSALGGTVDGEPITLGSVSLDKEDDAGWCVFFFEVA